MHGPEAGAGPPARRSPRFARTGGLRLPPRGAATHTKWGSVGAQAGLGLNGLLSQLQGSFRLLTQGCQTNLGRHQTLRATLDWSFELLNACEQTCLRRLGVFRGGFTLESAAAVIVGEHLEPGEIGRAHV